MTAVAKWSRYQVVAGIATSSSPVLLKTHHARELCTLNLSRAETPLVGVAQDNDRFLISCGGNKVVVWNFFCKKDTFVPKSRSRKEDKHLEPVTCVAVSRDGSLAVSVRGSVTNPASDEVVRKHHRKYLRSNRWGSVNTPNESALSIHFLITHSNEFYSPSGPD
ncbi:NACHT domain-and WD repeat-containing protein 1 [Trichonephila clavipes]|nr:NACHT domain-and WD repeat-containing protein 1 [Trichonephila clavipes]